jgi:hypothetical protein
MNEPKKRGAPWSSKDSAKGKLREFYAHNPNEWLTYDDVALKLGVTRRQAIDAVKNLKKTDPGIELVTVVRMVAE